MRVLSEVNEAEIAALRERDEFFWLDVEGPDEGTLDRLDALFDWHPLAIEDSRDFGQRPKLDDYEQYLLLVFYGVRAGPELLEVHAFVSGGYVVTIRQARCEQLVEERRRLSRHPGPSESYVVYRVIDALTDTFFPVLEAMDDAIDELEEEIAHTQSNAQLRRISRLKRDLIVMRRVVTPQRDLFARDADSIMDLPGLESGERDYFRDVYDHLIRISDLIDSYRDLLSGTTDVYLSSVSNRLNELTAKLTIVATIFLPLSVVTGFFGQNFGWLVGHIRTLEAFLVFGIGGLIVPAVGLYLWIRRLGRRVPEASSLRAADASARR